MDKWYHTYDPVNVFFFSFVLLRVSTDGGVAFLCQKHNFLLLELVIEIDTYQVPTYLR